MKQPEPGYLSITVMRSFLDKELIRSIIGDDAVVPDHELQLQLDALEPDLRVARIHVTNLEQRVNEIRAELRRRAYAVADADVRASMDIADMVQDGDIAGARKLIAALPEERMHAKVIANWIKLLEPPKVRV